VLGDGLVVAGEGLTGHDDRLLSLIVIGGTVLGEMSVGSVLIASAAFHR